MHKSIDHKPTIRRFIIKPPHSSKEMLFGKIIIETDVYEPFLDQFITYQFHVACNMSYIYFGIDEKLDTFKQDLREEINLFYIGEPEQHFYFFNKVLSKEGKELPLFFGAFYSSQTLKEAGNNKNILLFSNEIEDNFKHLILARHAHPTLSENYYYYLLFNGNNMHDALMYIKNPELILQINPDDPFYQPDYIPTKENALKFVLKNIIPELIDSNNRKDENVKEKSLLSYARAVHKSFFDFLVSEKLYKKCLRCDKYFLWVSRKKYCSHICLKSASNSRYYKKSLTK